MPATLATINVVLIQNVDEPAIDRLVSFPDTEEGRKDAEVVFLEWISFYSGRVLDLEDAEDALDEDSCKYTWVDDDEDIARTGSVTIISGQSIPKKEMQSKRIRHKRQVAAWDKEQAEADDMAIRW